MARSCSYVPREATFDRARLDSAKAYVRSEHAKSAWRDGSDSRGEVLNRLADSVVLQLNT